MNKGAKNKKQQAKSAVVKENQKISSYFAKVTQKTNDTHSKKVISENSSRSVNNLIKEVSEVDASVEMSQKKRKLSSQMKDEEFEIQPSTSARSPKKILTELHLSPETHNCCRSPRKRIPTPSKRVTTPNKITPTKKLFDKSPKRLEDFNVQVIENFVKITPSKSNKKLDSTDARTNKTPEKIQSSLIPYLSPSPKNKTVFVKMNNESTPTKSTPNKENSITPQSLKVKTRLNFDNCFEKVLLNFDSSPKTKECIVSANLQAGCSRLEISPLRSEFFEDSWDVAVNEVCAKYTLDLSVSQHCKVLEVDKFLSKSTILVECTKSKERAFCNLEGLWVYVQLNIGDTIHIRAKKSYSEWTVTNNHGLVVYEPDLLISSTSIVGSIFCKRKSVITERYKGFDPANRIMVIGSLVHKLLQNSLQIEAKDEDDIKQCLQNIMKQSDTVQMLYASSFSIEEATIAISGFIRRTNEFMERYIRKNAKIQKNDNNWRGTIDKIQEIEENFWCPELGVKGKVDVSVQVGESIMPLELKTGRATVSLEHRGQVILYLLMMEKFGYNVNSGLLLYLREGVLKEIPVSDKDKRDIIILRNELAFYLNKKRCDVASKEVFSNPISNGYLPEPINHHNACNSCAYNTICCAYLKTENYNLDSNPVLKKVQNEVLKDIKDPHIEYFLHWTMLLTLEATNRRDTKPLNEVFTLPPSSREKRGKCITNVKITNVEISGGLFSTTFEKAYDLERNLAICGINENSYVVVSTDFRPAVSAGFVSCLDSKSIVVTLDRDLTKKYSTSLFHIDTYDSENISLFNMTNLGLLLENSDCAKRIRALVIDKIPPKFKEKLPKALATVGAPILERLNKEQRRAVLCAMSANDYLLIKGMPGTGKTATIVALIQLVVKLGQSVLITSHTHSAVDNVCVRLQKYGVEILRLGSSKKVNPELQHRCESVLAKYCQTPEQLEEVYNSAKVVAVTCLGSGHPLLSKRTFDMCIVDESTQVIQPSLFRVLFAAKKFVLIGDPEQLPPVVQNLEALKLGMNESMFQRLQNSDSCRSLTLNYRMNSVITNLANGLTYNGELQVANENVANQHLQLHNFDVLLSEYKEYNWILESLDESLASSVKFLNTGSIWKLKITNIPIVQELFLKVSCEENSNDNLLNYCNPCESVIVAVLVQALLNSGVPSKQIGVIAPYRGQLTQLTHLLQSAGVEISTVDQFQGRDKSVVIFSCTKSCDISKTSKDEKYEILNDTRRLNVAITRAKHKLIIVGDKSTLQQYKPFCKLLGCMEESCFVNVMENVEDFLCVVKALRRE